MRKINTIFSENRTFFIGYLLFVITCIFLLANSTKTESFFLLNRYHTKPIDWFLAIYTNVGDGLFSIAIFLVLLWKRRPLPGWEIVISFLLSGLVAQVIKHFFQMPRPMTFIGEANYAHFIKGVTLSGYASFPSGHTATAFSTALLLAIFAKNKKYNLLYFFAALLVAYSRVYLGEHFLQDIFAGSLIGVTVALFVYLLIDGKPTWFQKMKRREIGDLS